MPKCCTECFSDIAIKEKIRALATTDRCGYCYTAQTMCVEPTELKDKIELLTYGLSENEDGHTLAEILRNTYCVISDEVRDFAGLIDDIFLEQGFSQKRFVFETDHASQMRSWEEFKEELTHKNRFFPKNTIYSSVFKTPPEGSDSGVFFQLLEQLKNPIYEQELFFRARISDDRLTEDEMGCPPPKKATGGRANPAGIPYLYLAENVETCICEVRPSNSSTVYISECQPRAQLNILDLSSPRKTCSVASFEEDQLTSVLTFLNLLELLSIDLSKPVRPENSHLEYIPTQFLCEFIKTEGKFDGLSFSSSFNSGKNYVIFDPESFRIMPPNNYIITNTRHEHRRIE